MESWAFPTKHRRTTAIFVS